MSLAIRPARPGEAGIVLSLVRELADYERLSHEVDATEAMIDAALFGPAPKAFCDIAEWDGAPVGLALWFLNFSSFRGRCGLYLEDVFVQPPHRGKGIGRALLKALARRCVENEWARFEWTVLDWNAPAIAFYESIGANVLPDWRVCRVTGDALLRMAEAEDTHT